MHKLSLLFLCLFWYSMKAQDCSGSLGENIFPDGTFGSGLANIAPDPGIAPGYSYITNPPPNDGMYTITNNTTNWGGFATDWINIRDNSADPNGYMMVVNASFNPGLFYQRTVNICGRTTYEFSADVISMNNPAIANQFIKPNISFLINGEVVFNSGDVPIDGSWHTYRFAFTSEDNVQQLELALRNNAPGGFGNDLALDNISFRPCGPRLELADTIPFCGDRPLSILSNLAEGFDTPVFQWQVSEDNGQSWITIPGANQNEFEINRPQEGNKYRLLLANTQENIIRPSCRIVSNFSTLRYQPQTFNIEAKICRGDSYNLNNQVYFSEGIYEQLLQTSDGCDSLIRLDLSFGDPRDFSISGDSILCNNRQAFLDAGDFSSYLWSDGSTGKELMINREGLYTVTVTNSLGCTAIDEIQASNSQLSAKIETIPPACSGEDGWQILVSEINNGFPPHSFSLNQGIFQENEVFSGLAPGVYDITVMDQSGCQFTSERELFNGEKLSLSLTASEEVKLGDSIEVSFNTNRPVTMYNWSPNEGLSCTNCANPVIRPLNNITYILEVSDANGCMAADSFNIRVLKERKYFAPNVFSPNGDGKNDYFRPFFSNSVEQIGSFRIFDRWGSLVFERGATPSQSEALRWDGRFNGNILPKGIYVWMAEVIYIDGISQQISGDVLLLR